MDINIISKKKETGRTREKKSEHIKRSDRRKGEKGGNKIGNKVRTKAEFVICHNYSIESHQPQSYVLLPLEKMCPVIYCHYKLLHHYKILVKLKNKINIDIIRGQKNDVL